MRYHPKSSMRAYLIIKLIDKGKTIYRKKQRVRSYLGNWTKGLYGLLYDNMVKKVVTIKDASGSEFAFPNLNDETNACFSVTSAEGNANRGIVFGSGTAEVDINDYQLASKIPHGTGSGQLYYYSCSLKWEVLSDRGRLYIIRSASNQSDSEITVSEVGVQAEHYEDPGSFRYILILRDLLDPAVTLDVGQTISATYILEFLL